MVVDLRTNTKQDIIINICSISIPIKCKDILNSDQISGQEWGDSSGEAWIALHGWLDNCGTFDNLAPFFQNNQKRFLAIDLPGHGFSSHYTPGRLRKSLKT